jgi:predicted transcriptional regulator
MRIFWSHGAATVRELSDRLVTNPPLAYTTLMSMCVRLYEKGLLGRCAATEARPRRGETYVYTPILSEAEYTRRAIGRSVQQYRGHLPLITEPSISDDTEKTIAPDCDNQVRVERVLAELGVLHTSGSQGAMHVRQVIATLIDRAEAAELAVVRAGTRLRRAELRIEALEQRAQAAERQAQSALRQVASLEQQLGRPVRQEPKKRPLHGLAVVLHGAMGICRVCRAPAPPPYASRQDGLRVCADETCRQQARRRDNVAKQRRYTARWLSK